MENHKTLQSTDNTQYITEKHWLFHDGTTEKIHSVRSVRFKQQIKSNNTKQTHQRPCTFIMEINRRDRNKQTLHTR